MKQLIMMMVFGLLVCATACNTQKNTQVTDTSEARATNRQARKGPPNIEEVFKMDANNDGKLSKTEIKGRLLKNFDKIDTDQDGFLSREEIENAPKPKRGNRPPRQ